MLTRKAAVLALHLFNDLEQIEEAQACYVSEKGEFKISINSTWVTVPVKSDIARQIAYQYFDTQKEDIEKQLTEMGFSVEKESVDLNKQYQQTYGTWPKEENEKRSSKKELLSDWC